MTGELNVALFRVDLSPPPRVFLAQAGGVGGKNVGPAS